jgi:hypothetical protein
MAPEQLALLDGAVGFFVSLLLQWLKKKWPALDNSSATVKQITAVVVAMLGVLILAKFQITTDLLWQAAIAGIAVLGTHKQLLATTSASAPEK